MNVMLLLKEGLDGRHLGRYFAQPAGLLIGSVVDAYEVDVCEAYGLPHGIYRPVEVEEGGARGIVYIMAVEGWDDPVGHFGSPCVVCQGW